MTQNIKQKPQQESTLDSVAKDKHKSKVPSSWQGKILLSLGVLLSGLMMGIGILVVLTLFWAAPDLSKFQLRSNVLYDNSGELLYEMMSPDEYHRVLTLPDNVDPIYLKMLLSSEDERFWQHYGVDPRSILRALVSNISAGYRVSGASTLAMQVCRLLEPKERTWLNKLKEALGALYITYKYGREQVLAMYLTLAPFGGNIEGVTAASYSYFNHSPKHLTPAEAALLVALPRSPEKIRPDRHHQAALYYRNEVLKKAVNDGLIQQDILATATIESVPQFTHDLPNSAMHLGQSIFAGRLHYMLESLNFGFSTPMDQHISLTKILASNKTSIALKANQQSTNKTIQHAHNQDLESQITAQQNLLNDADSITTQQNLLNDTESITAQQNLLNDADSITAQQNLLNGTASNQVLDQTKIRFKPWLLNLRFTKDGRRLPSEVFTTIDPQVQKTLNELIASYQEQTLQGLEQENVAMLAVNNQTFTISGYACSDQSFVDIIQAIRSPGSALKPFAYAMAFEDGLLHPHSILLDLGKIYRTYQPRNYDRMFFGEISAAQALQGSLNLPALEVMRALGPVNFVNRINAVDAFKLLSNSALNHKNTASSNQIAFITQAEDKTINIIEQSDKTEYQQQHSLIQKDSIAHNEMSSTAIQHSVSNLLQNIALQDVINNQAQGYLKGRLKLMENTEPNLGVILGACGISLYDLTQLYAALAHDGQMAALQIFNQQQNPIFDTNKTAYTSTKQSTLENAVTILSPEAARITYKILEGLPVPSSFNYERNLKISYKTGTSFKYRDTVAIGSRGNLTISVWQGRTDGDPSNLPLSAYEKVAPLLFRALTLAPSSPVYKPTLPQSGLLSVRPPQALEHIEIRELGQTSLRRNNELQSNNSFTQTMPLEIAYPSDGMKIFVGTSGQILLQIQGGTPPYYVLIDDKPQDDITYFTPKHNGVYTITAIDATGQNQVVQILVQGVEDSNL